MATKIHKLEGDYQTLLAEFNILKCRLDSKTEAVLILSRELDQYRSERDQYKLMADQLRERYSALKKRVEGWGPSLLGVYDMRSLKGDREQSLVQLLCELKEQNKSLQFEAVDLKQKLSDAQGDIRLLREQIARHRVGSTEEGVNTRHFPACEREDLVKQLEAVRQKCLMLERDLQAILDEKEELVTIRDAYRHKVERLNQQLNSILRGGEQTIVDIDAVLMENRYLQERIKQIQEEKSMLTAALAKYKSMLEKKRSRSGVRFGIATGGLTVTNKQVQQLLQTNPFLEVTNSTAGPLDLKNLVITLFESLNDKTLALSHQKKTNKILGNRITELEKKLKTTEASNLWHIPDADKIASMIQTSQTEDQLAAKSQASSRCSLSTQSPEHCSVVSSDVHEEELTEKDGDLTPSSRRNSGFNDLDLLPTKESPMRERCRSSSVSNSETHFSDSQLSTPAQSPFHQDTVLHSDSEVTPWKSEQSSSKCHRFHSHRSHSDSVDDDLPPKLQKLLAAALAEIELQSTNQGKGNEGVIATSPARHSPAKVDPNC